MDSSGNCASVVCKVSMGEGMVGISESGVPERKTAGVLGKKSSSMRYCPVIRLCSCRRARRPRCTILRTISSRTDSEMGAEPLARTKLCSSMRM